MPKNFRCGKAVVLTLLVSIQRLDEDVVSGENHDDWQVLVD